MYPESSDGLNRETSNAIYFFTPAFHPFDNFSAHQLLLWGLMFPTAEHAFQWKKFSEIRPDVAKQILKASSPHKVKEISRANKVEQPADWNDRKVSIMQEILAAKIEQHEDMRELLRKTGDRTIIENSPEDLFWGIGSTGEGKNMVGKILMELRKTI